MIPLINPSDGMAYSCRNKCRLADESPFGEDGICPERSKPICRVLAEVSGVGGVFSTDIVMPLQARDNTIKKVKNKGGVFLVRLFMFDFARNLHLSF